MRRFRTGISGLFAAGILVATLFNVTVINVRTIVTRGKVKRVGRFAGQRPGMKKAIVTLKAGDNISFFEGV